MRVVDELGLVRENGIIVVHFLFNNTILPLRVVRRANKGNETFTYGALPVSFSGYSSGVIPSRQTSTEFTFTYSRLLPEEQTDMWYFTDEKKIYHVYINIEPAYMLRVFRRIPYGSTPYVFRSVSASPTDALEIEFGFTRGKWIEQVFLPNIKIGWIVANPTNVDLRTYVKFIYGDYDVEFISNPDTIWDIMTGKISAHWVTFGGIAPITGGVLNKSMEALHATPIQLLPTYMSRDEAVAQISNMISAGGV